MSAICTAEGCSAAAVARGLCMKHYMAARRAATRKPRKVADDVAWVREAGAHKSPRTQATMLQSLRLLARMPDGYWQNAMNWASRRNGTLNVSLLNQSARMWAFNEEPRNPNLHVVWEQRQKRLREEQ
jgi:hypothetical protein